MLQQLNDQRIRHILSHNGNDEEWRPTLERLRQNDQSLNRQSAHEDAVKAMQRMLIFSGYSTSSSGAFVIDGDFGRGTNRGVAQFQLEHRLNTPGTRNLLCYDCSFQTARKRITAIPDTTVDIETLATMADVAIRAIDSGEITFGDFDQAMFHLNALHGGNGLTCEQISSRYGDVVRTVADRLKQKRGVTIEPSWILAIIRQETAGVVRPRFEQHKLSKANRDMPDKDFAEFRVRSMNIGLGQIMGFNHKIVGAPSARAMLFSPLDEQVLFVARFIARKKTVVAKSNPTMKDFREMAKFYNGPGFETHAYHEKLEKWFFAFQDGSAR